jgi:hypothetical protein
MDKISKILLTVIATALCAIAFKMYFPGNSILSATTFGEFISLHDIHDDNKRKEMYQAMTKRMLLVRIQGGKLEADVSGNVYCTIE